MSFDNLFIHWEYGRTSGDLKIYPWLTEKRFLCPLGRFWRRRRWMASSTRTWRMWGTGHLGERSCWQHDIDMTGLLHLFITQRCPTYIDTAHGADPYIYLQQYLGFISSYRFVNHTLFRQCLSSTWQLSSNIYMEYSSDDIAAARSLQFAMVRLLVDTRADNTWQFIFH
jgi:hypothetical protein